MTAADAQTHRSIGEVLSLLQEEYPDVTISKIRFLESQGLVAPERTASGFRKFYDSDIQRLRWILSKQTDHFLPLKVIKKMLDEGADTSVIGEAESQQTLWSMDGEPATAAGSSAAAASAHVPESDTSVGSGQEVSVGATSADGTTSVMVGEGASPDRSELIADESHRSGSDEGSRRSRGGTSRQARRRAERSRQPSPTHPSIVGRTMVGNDAPPSSDATVDHQSVVAGAGVESTPPVAAGQESEGDGARAGSRDRPHKGIMTPADIVAALQEDPRRDSAHSSSVRGGSDGPPASPTTSVASVDQTRVRQFSVEDLTSSRGRDDFLSAEELCEMFDIEQSLLDELERFGLIAPRRYGGTTSYDGSDTEIIAVSVKYASMGVEPRHLRMYKIAAEREAGFVEQLVLPILKQRNPTAKQNAAERSSQLASMGDELHNLILRRHLRNLLDNR